MAGVRYRVFLPSFFSVNQLIELTGRWACPFLRGGGGPRAADADWLRPWAQLIGWQSAAVAIGPSLDSVRPIR